MNFEILGSLPALQTLIAENAAVAVYFSHEACNVCKVLKPKVLALIEDNFPNIVPVYADTMISPEIAAQFGVFTVPCLLVFFDGKELIRRSRHFGIGELGAEIERPYAMRFD